MAQQLPVPETRKNIHPIIRTNTTASRTHQRAIVCWILGRVAFHQQCKNCTGQHELSRAHAIQCSNTTARLQTLEASLQTSQDLQPNNHETLLDKCINKNLKNHRNRDRPRIWATIANIIETIRRRCLHAPAFFDEAEMSPIEAAEHVLRQLHQDHPQRHQSQEDAEVTALTRPVLQRPHPPPPENPIEQRLRRINERRNATGVHTIARHRVAGRPRGRSRGG